MSVYLSRPDGPPDTEFEPGELHHLVVGNTARLLDPRRTPVSVVGVRTGPGFFDVRIDDFEDAGAIWEIPFEKVNQYQFARGADRADADRVQAFRAAIARLDRPLEIPCSPESRAATRHRLATECEEAAAWIDASSAFVRDGATLPDPDRREGDPRLSADLEAFMASRDLADLEAAFARQFVSNPYSGELVKGHCIVMAELGLAAFTGTVARDPDLFEGHRSRDRRADHVCARLAFVSALFARLGRPRVVLYRGLSTERPLDARDDRTFVSASFSEVVARSHYEAGSEDATRLLMRQSVPVERLFMTYHETAAMNGAFREAEAVLLADPGNRLF